MSIRVMSDVWSNGPEDRNELLVLLALADFCDDEGRCWPSMRAIAEKARMTERGVQKVVARLVESGRLKVDIGGGRHGCNTYTIATGNPEPRSGYHGRNPEPETPNTVHPPRTDEQETPNTVPKTPNLRSPEPSRTIIEPSVKSAYALSPARPPPKAFLPPDWVPSQDDVAYALSQQLTRPEIEEMANDFRSYWTERRDAKSKRTDDGWRRTWQGWVRRGAGEYTRNRRRTAGKPAPASMASIVARRRLEAQDEDDFPGVRWLS